MFPLERLAVPANSPSYVVDLVDASRHLANIALWIPLHAAPVEIVFPVWTPGSYLIREYTRNIESIRASVCRDPYAPHQSRSAVVLRREGKNRWVADVVPSQGWLVIEYTLYCRENSVRTNWIDQDYGFITGAATFPWIEGALDRPIHLVLQMPNHWSSTASSLTKHVVQDRINGPSPQNLVEYLATDFHELVDSPIVCGNFQERQFEVSHHLHRLVHVGDDGLWDLDRAVADVQAIVAKHHDFWQEIPYTTYNFLNLCTEAGGGLEHDNSTVLMCSRWAMRRRDSYLNWLSLVSHEFFHTWNVRRLRPRALMMYNYQSEQFFEELWIAEGITSYFDDLLLVRSGLCSAEEYLARLSKTIQSVQDTPGRMVQDLASASWDTWVKFYRPDENSHNSRISYYHKGCLLAWLLDAMIRQHTDNQVALDDVVRRLWTEHRSSGYTLVDFENLVEQSSSLAIRQWLGQQVAAAGELDLTIALRQFGLRFKQNAITNSRLAAQVWFGADFRSTEGKLLVSRIIRHSPADQAGLNVDDELIACDGFRVTPESWPSRLEVYQPRDRLKLLICRRGKVRQLQIVLGQTTGNTWQLEVDPQAQPTKLSHWLGNAVSPGYARAGESSALE